MIYHITSNKIYFVYRYNIIIYCIDFSTIFYDGKTWRKFRIGSSASRIIKLSSKSDRSLKPETCRICLPSRIICILTIPETYIYIAILCRTCEIFRRFIFWIITPSKTILFDSRYLYQHIIYNTYYTRKRDSCIIIIKLMFVYFIRLRCEIQLAF